MSVIFILSLILFFTITAERESFSAEDPLTNSISNDDQAQNGTFFNKFNNWSPNANSSYISDPNGNFYDNNYSGNDNQYPNNGGYFEGRISDEYSDNEFDNRFSRSFQNNESAENPSFSSENFPEETQDLSDNPNWQEHNVANWKWQVLPTGMMFPSYLAGRKEPRLGCVFTDDFDYGGLWDIQLGGRIPLLRYGTTNAVQPEGWQVELEGAALLRLDFERQRELAGTDYRAGIFLVRAFKRWQFKIGNYHISSHLGDQYILADFRLPRIQYTRDEIVFGIGFRPIPALRFYGEIGAAYKTGATTDPIELQFGAEYSAPYNPQNNLSGSPFAAVHGHLFQELDYSGYMNLQAGWQWRGKSNDLLRLGVEFFTGCDDQFQFHYYYQKKLGFLIALDF